MRRSVLSPRGTRGPIQAVLRTQPRRRFATPPIKNTTIPKPIEPSKEQAIPVGPYYESILDSARLIPETYPIRPPSSAIPEPETPSKTQPGKKPKTPKADTAKASPPTPSAPTPTPPPDSPEEKVRVIFGTRLAGPSERAERLAAIKNRSTVIAGVRVPPKPEEPDNCCMSGCVNCVWDLFRDDIEEWAAANQEAERRLRAQEAGVGATEDSMAPRAEVRVGHQELDHGAVSMDDDGGGSSGNWDVGDMGQESDAKLSKDFWDEELYKNIPIGIQEFMKQEKRLKQKHMQDGTVGG